MRIGICAPSTPFTRDDAARVTALAAESHPEAELAFDDQCFIEQGHFAGSDAQLPLRPGSDEVVIKAWRSIPDRPRTPSPSAPLRSR